VKQELNRGLDHYATVQQELSAHVSPEEAFAASKLTNASLMALLVGVIAIVILGGSVHLLHARGQHAFAEYVAAVAPLTVSMLLISRWRVLWAGRIVLMTAAVVLVPMSERYLSIPVMAFEWKLVPAIENYASAAIIGNGLLFAIILGWLLDRAAASNLNDSARLRWPVLLTIFAVSQCAVLWLLLGLAEDRVAWNGFLIRLCLVLLWCWVLHPRFVDRRRYDDSDTGTVFMMGMTRWGRRLVGRALAVGSLTVIAVATLNGVALPRAFELNGSDNAIVSTLSSDRGAPPALYAFFVPKLGRLLRASDFGDQGRRWFRTDDLPKALGDELSRLKFYGDHEGYLPTTASYWNELATKLEPWRINSAVQFADYCASRPGLSVKELHVWALEKTSTSSHGMHSDGKTSDYFIVDLRRASKLVLADKVDASLSLKKLQMLAAATFASLAFVTLWRRGGDSKAARWIGIWLASAAMSFALPLIRLVYQSTFTSVANVMQVPPVRVTLNGLFHLLFGFEMALFMLTISGLTYWMIYRHMRLPGVSQSTLSPRLRAALDGRTAIAAGALLSLLVAGFLSSYLGARWFAVCTAFTSALTIAGLNWIRHRYLKLSDAVDPRFRFTRGSYILAAVAVGMSLAAPFLERQSQYGQSAVWGVLEAGGFWLVIGTLIAFIAASTLLILRTDWLRLSSGRSLSWLATAFALPLIFEFTNNSLPRVFESSGIFLPEAADVASVLVVVALLQPLQRSLEVAFEAISSPVTRDLRRRLDEILETSVGAEDAGQLRENVEALLRSYGIERYALWVRQRRFDFVPTVDHLSVVDRITLSESLCGQLAKVRGVVVDIETVHSEWKYFFYQFELHRLTSMIKGRYLYAVPFGRSLWGLLVLEDSAASGGIARHTFAEIASEIGVALSLKRK
jgi:hypothetical protein